MGVRELVENSLDASELAGMLPDVYVRIVANEASPENTEPRAYRLSVADNGPGVDPHQVPRAFGKVFYGSKYVLRQSRGMFGLGGTMAILYGQITTNKPVKITTSTDGKSRHVFEMLIDISENKPIIVRKDVEDAMGKTGTRVDLVMEGDFTRAAQKINDYFKQTALVGSYANLTFVDPIGRITSYERATEAMPPAPKETLPHPYGVDVEALKRMIKITDEKNMVNFMANKHFHRVGDTIAKKFLTFAGIDWRVAPEKLTNEQIVRIVDALQRFPDFLPPDASCLSPVGEEILQTGIIKELAPEFSTVVLRPPSSYSGFPFLVEVGLVYGGKVLEPGRKLFRFANRIPLLYDECYSEDTRVLTRDGFKLFSSLSKEDELATLNPVSSALEFQRPTRIMSYDHDGPMVRFKSGFADLLVTPNHRMYCARRNKPYTFYTAAEILTVFNERRKETAEKASAYERTKQLAGGGSGYSQISQQLPLPYGTVRGWLNGSHKALRFSQGPRPHFFIKRDADWAGEWDSEYFVLPPAPRTRGSHHCQRVNKIRMDLWLRFLGWYLAEGSAFRDKGGYLISLGFGDKDLRHKKEIDDALRALSVQPRWIKTGEHSYEIRFSHKQLYGYVSKLGHAGEKYIPNDIKALPKGRLNILLSSLLDGDGTVTRTGTKVFGTVKSARLASDVGEIAIKCGYAVTFGYAKKGMCVYLNVKHKSTMIKQVESARYHGKVWCATVPNHIMLVERAGKTAWSGNSSDVSFQVINEQIDWKRYHVPDEAPVAVITHIASTKIPYKTVGKEYIADRPEIEAEIKNAVRESLRRLSVFLSKKGSMEAVQRKMNIYGKYLPLMAKFSTELAGKKKEPRYKQLLKDEEEEAAAEAPPETAAEGEEKTDGEKIIEQTTIEDYR